MTSVAVPICESCIHLDRSVDQYRCAAYPAGIPTEIVESEVDHRLPYDGDHGIQFEQHPDTQPPDDLVFEGAP